MQTVYLEFCVSLGSCCRSQACVGNSLPPYKVGSLNSKLFLSEISKREKSLRRMLEGRSSNTSIRFAIQALTVVSVSDILQIMFITWERYRALHTASPLPRQTQKPKQTVVKLLCKWLTGSLEPVKGSMSCSRALSQRRSGRSWESDHC